MVKRSISFQSINMKLLIVLCVASLVFSAPSPQTRNTIDFLLDLNQDVLEGERETPASVQPLPQAQVVQVSTSTASPNVTTSIPTSTEPAPVREENTTIQQTQDESKPTVTQMNTTTARNESVESNNSDEEKGTSEVISQEQEVDISNETNEKDSNENTTSTNLDSREDFSSTENSTEDEHVLNGNTGGHHGETDTKVPQMSHSPQDNQNTKQQQETVDLRLTNNEATNGNPKVEVKPNQVFNHGTLVVEKSTLKEQQLNTRTTPLRKQDRGNEPDGWYSKFEFDGHKHGTHLEDGPPRWNQWGQHAHGNQDHDHYHMHDYEHRHGNGQYEQRHGHEHHRGHEYDHSYDDSQEHGFHRNGPWKWH